MELTESLIREMVRDEVKLIFAERAKMKMKIIREITKALRRGKGSIIERGRDNHDYVNNHDNRSTKC